MAVEHEICRGVGLCALHCGTRMPVSESATELHSTGPPARWPHNAVGWLAGWQVGILYELFVSKQISVYEVLHTIMHVGYRARDEGGRG